MATHYRDWNALLPNYISNQYPLIEIELNGIEKLEKKKKMRLRIWDAIWLSCQNMLVMYYRVFEGIAGFWLRSEKGLWGGSSDDEAVVIQSAAKEKTLKENWRNWKRPKGLGPESPDKIAGRINQIKMVEKNHVTITNFSI